MAKIDFPTYNDVTSSPQQTGNSPTGVIGTDPHRSRQTNELNTLNISDIRQYVKDLDLTPEQIAEYHSLELSLRTAGNDAQRREATANIQKWLGKVQENARADLMYRESLAGNQVNYMTNAGMSRAAALAALSGGSSPNETPATPDYTAQAPTNADLAFQGIQTAMQTAEGLFSLYSGARTLGLSLPLLEAQTKFYGAMSTLYGQQGKYLPLQNDGIFAAQQFDRAYRSLRGHSNWQPEWNESIETILKGIQTMADDGNYDATLFNDNFVKTGSLSNPFARQFMNGMLEGTFDNDFYLRHKLFALEAADLSNYSLYTYAEKNAEEINKFVEEENYISAQKNYLNNVQTPLGRAETRRVGKESELLEQDIKHQKVENGLIAMEFMYNAQGFDKVLQMRAKDVDNVFQSMYTDCVPYKDKDGKQILISRSLANALYDGEISQCLKFITSRFVSDAKKQVKSDPTITKRFGLLSTPEGIRMLEAIATGAEIESRTVTTGNTFGNFTISRTRQTQGQRAARSILKDIYDYQGDQNR